MLAIQSCMQALQLTCLTLRGFSQFNPSSEQLASCLQRMPRLQSLQLGGLVPVRSLSFLSAGTLASTLTSLTLGDYRRQIPLVELQQVHGLTPLRSLTLAQQTFDDELSPFDQRIHSPPSLRLPQLRRFVHEEYPPIARLIR